MYVSLLLSQTHPRDWLTMSSSRAFPLLAHPRSNGYTVCAQTSFASAEDMQYYDTECPAHMALREAALGLITEVPLVVVEEFNPDEGGEFRGASRCGFGHKYAPEA